MQWNGKIWGCATPKAQQNFWIVGEILLTRWWCLCVGVIHVVISSSYHWCREWVEAVVVVVVGNIGGGGIRVLVIINVWWCSRRGNHWRVVKDLKIHEIWNMWPTVKVSFNDAEVIRGILFKPDPSSATSYVRMTKVKWQRGASQKKPAVTYIMCHVSWVIDVNHVETRSIISCITKLHWRQHDNGN